MLYAFYMSTGTKVTKAHAAMDGLLMAYASMLDYSFEGASEMRAKVMEIIHALEVIITSEMEAVETDLDDEEYYGKEIVQEDGQFCVRSKDGTRNFGCYISRERAEERLGQVESFANKLADMSNTELSVVFDSSVRALEGDATALVKALATDEIILRSLITEAVDELEKNVMNLTPIIKSEQRYTMGPVYVPELEDAHGETIEADELQKAIWDWVRKGDRTIYLQHSEKPAGEMVEILTWPMPIETSLIVPTEGVTKYSFPANTPFMGVIWEDWAWELVKSGQLRGYSIGGKAQRVEVELPV